MKPLIVANWKCNPTTLKKARRLFNLVKRGAEKIKRVETVICPPFVFLPDRKKQMAAIKLGGQNCFWEKGGSYTGEISPEMLRDLGCKYVIIGHSERRRYFNETDEIVNKKLRAALKAKLSPIFCIGETKTEREKGKTESVLKRQIVSGLKKIPAAKASKIAVAYEPIWAIGTGNPCDIEEAQKMGLLIRKIISNIYSRAVSAKIRILYGGSVNSKNGAGYIKEAGMQGLLVGGASLNAKEFIRIIKSV